MKRFIAYASVAALTLLLGACGSEPEPVASVAAPSPAPDATATAKAPEDPALKMARAVGNGKPGAAVDLRYEFGGKPAVGTPTELQVALIPNPGVDAMQATISGMDGVTLAGPLEARFADVDAGKPYTHTVSLLPDRSGVFYITVVVNTDIGGSQLARTFSIPFVVGTPQAQQKAEPQRDAKGEPIESMKAEESTG